MDIAIQLSVVGLVVTLNFFVLQHTRKWFNPLTIISITFFVPLVFALFRLSGLQAKSWEYETYALIILAIGAWLVLPAMTLLIAQKKAPGVREALTASGLADSRTFFRFSRWFALIVGASYVAGNYIQAGTLLPLNDPELAYRLHSEFPPVIRFFARANPAAVGLLFVAFYFQRRKSDLALLLFVFLIPLSRYSRIDPFMSVVVMLVLNTYLPIVRHKARHVVIAALVVVSLAVLAVELGNQRENRFGLQRFKYQDAILWKPDLVGPYSTLPVAYGYSSLSFENLNGFVRTNKLNRTYGVMSFDWFFTGIVKFNWLRSFNELSSGLAAYRPVSSAANVPTALYPFFADFGAALAWIPMCIYMAFWLELYRRAASSLKFALLYAVYSAGFALSTFQAVIVSPLLVQQLIEIALLFHAVQTLGKPNAARRVAGGASARA